jgi:hypothetical protein
MMTIGRIKTMGHEPMTTVPIAKYGRVHTQERLYLAA